MVASAIPMILTRPDRSGQRFLDALPAAITECLDVIRSPLIEIVGTPTAAKMMDEEVAVFTSANAVGFAPKGAGRVAFCVGSATQEAASGTGWRARDIGPDAETLVKNLIERAPRQALVHFHGTHTRGDVMGELSSAGLKIRGQVVYDQAEKQLSDRAKSVLNGASPVILPLFSPRTASLFAFQYTGSAPLWVAGMSRAVVEQLQDLRLAGVTVAAAPNLAEMVRATEILIQRTRLG